MINFFRNKRSMISRFLHVAIGVSVCIFALIPGTSCYNEKFTTESTDTLAITIDTLTFDTVLTEISTVTRYFKVYNPHDASLRISEIKVTGSEASFFTLNVDGYTGESIKDIEIRPDDSIYVFVDAIIDPDQPVSVSPFILEAEIEFLTNGTSQSV